MDSMMMVIPNTFAWVRKTRCTGRAGVLLAVVALLAIQQGLSAQLTYRSGQRVFPAYEGWEEDDDGSRYFLFGYMNANWEEELDVPVGPDNFVVAVTDDATSGGESELFMPTMADQGQPTRFLPRRNRFVFRVPVPDGVEGTALDTDDGRRDGYGVRDPGDRLQGRQFDQGVRTGGHRRGARATRRFARTSCPS